jgi:hypothetical protein
VVFATATAVAATTHGLASHSHQLKEYVRRLMVSMLSWPAKKRYMPAKIWMQAPQEGYPGMYAAGTKTASAWRAWARHTQRA